MFQFSFLRVDENIDGDLFLGLLEDKELLSDLKLTAGGKAKIRSILNVSNHALSYDKVLRLYLLFILVCRK